MIVRPNVGVEQRPCLVATRCRSQIEAAHDLLDLADGEALALRQDRDRVREPRDLRHGVAHVDDRDVKLVAKALDVVEDLALARYVERRQRLVHQEDARLREQGPADRDPLLLAAGERRGLAFEQCAEAEKIDHPLALDQALGRRAQALPVGEVRLDGKMRKEQRVLEDVADAPALRRDIDPLPRIEQHGVVDADRAPRRLADAGDGVDHASSCPRRSGRRGRGPAHPRRT